MYKFLLLTIFVSQSFGSFSQTFWKIDAEDGDEILLTVEVNYENKTFEAFTRKDALKDIAGLFSYTLAKAAGKVKYPEIVFIQGNAQSKKDSLLLSGTFSYLDKHYPFSAAISGNSFKGKYIDKNRTRPMIGVKMPNDKPINDYKSIINTVFSLTEKNILNPLWLKSNDWLDFKEKIRELIPVMSDDYELAASLIWVGRKLPFSSFEIDKNRPQGKITLRKNIAAIRELKPKTAFFDVNMLPSTKRDMDSIAAIIFKKGYANLIIDLRGRRSLNLGSANELINFLSDKAFVAGVFLTRKWFDDNAIVPKPQDYVKLFKSFSESGLKEDEFYKESGRVLNCVPRAKTFKGKVYVLTDSNTSKGSEALVYALKKEKIATVIGQKTAGDLELSENLRIDDEYDLVLPVADFYNCEGKTLNEIGVEPDINVSGEDALNYVLKIL